MEVSLKMKRLPKLTLTEIIKNTLVAGATAGVALFHPLHVYAQSSKPCDFENKISLIDIPGGKKCVLEGKNSLSFFYAPADSTDDRLKKCAENGFGRLYRKNEVTTYRGIRRVELKSNQLQCVVYNYTTKEWMHQSLESLFNASIFRGEYQYWGCLLYTSPSPRD